MQVDVSFETWKRLTALLEDEHDTYDAVILRFIDAPTESAKPSKSQGHFSLGAVGGTSFKGVWLPEGTEFRATYKGVAHSAKISEGQWIDSTGKVRTSPSQAAYMITGSGVNGWLFWMVKRPTDEHWQSLNDLRSASGQ